MKPTQPQSHTKIITKFYILDLPSYCTILGIDFLSIHNPTINYSTKDLVFQSNLWISNCLILPSSFILLDKQNLIKKLILIFKIFNLSNSFLSKTSSMKYILMNYHNVDFMTTKSIYSLYSTSLRINLPLDRERIYNFQKIHWWKLSKSIH